MGFPSELGGGSEIIPHSDLEKVGIGEIDVSGAGFGAEVKVFQKEHFCGGDERPSLGEIVGKGRSEVAAPEEFRFVKHF